MSYDVELSMQTVGGTDIGVLTGSNPYETPFELLERKRNNIEKTYNLKMIMGQHLEGLIANVFEASTGIKLYGSGDDTILLGNKRATIDRYYIDDFFMHVVDIKTRWMFWKNKILPQYYADQVIYYTGMMEDTSYYGNYLLGDPKIITMYAGDLYIADVPYNRDYYKVMKSIADEFADYIHNDYELKTSQIIIWRKQVEKYINNYKEIECIIMSGLVVAPFTT